MSRRAVIDWLRPEWPLPGNVLAATTTRRGGVSEGLYGELNLGAHVGDSPAAVRENRRRLTAALNLTADPAWLCQVHGTRVIDVSAIGDDPPEADASVSDVAGQVCVVMTADCLPVLFASADGRRVGAAHAGWRGLLDGVLENTVQALESPPETLTAWLGPAISQPAFEVGSDVRDAFVSADADAAAHFDANARGRYQADLYALARQRLARAGVTAVYGGGWCTFGDPDRFFSYRRDGACGRMATIIAIQHSSD